MPAQRQPDMAIVLDYLAALGHRLQCGRGFQDRRHGFSFAFGRGREEGAKTRTWFRVKDQPVFAWGGLWRRSSEWGDVYSGVMTDCNEAIRPVHYRMPVLLMPDEYDRWLNGSFEDVVGFQERCSPDDLIEMQRTSELWVKRKPAVEAATLF